MRYERGWKAGKAIKILVCIVAFVAVIGYVVMSLWNWLVPDLFHGPQITFWQAFGLFVLSKLLLSGGKGGPWGWKGREHWRDKMRSRMEHMSEEDREKMRNAFRRCGSRFRQGDAAQDADRFRERARARFRERYRGYREPGYNDTHRGPEPPQEPGSDVA